MEANSQVQNVKLGGHQTYLSINRLCHELCDMLRRFVGTTAPRHHDCSIEEWKNEDFAILKVKNWRSIAGRRAERKKLLRKAQAHKRLSSQF
ncbi:hypothetical protein TNCV_3145551 [Trichonephila clavipes]|nr:hypothetical protein TNCV_3145551 [Trichonephila clavipes]